MNVSQREEPIFETQTPKNQWAGSYGLTTATADNPYASVSNKQPRRIDKAAYIQASKLIQKRMDALGWTKRGKPNAGNSTNSNPSSSANTINLPIHSPAPRRRRIAPFLVPLTIPGNSQIDGDAPPPREELAMFGDMDGIVGPVNHPSPLPELTPGMIEQIGPDGEVPSPKEPLPDWCPFQ